MIVDPLIEKFILDLLPARDEVLAEMEAQAAERDIPIVGPAVGSLLAVLVRSCQAKRIFELGSAIGYSTLWLARAAGPGSEIHFTDSSATRADEARGYFERAGVADRIHIHVGDALTELSRAQGQFDFIFNDVDKVGYPAVLDAVPSRLRAGGLFVTDNTLYHGRVLRPQEHSSSAVVDFDTKLFKSQEFLSCMIPLRDGLAIAVRG
jgi:predicted O-methyltransferase YrrM